MRLQEDFDLAASLDSDMEHMRAQVAAAQARLKDVESQGSQEGERRLVLLQQQADVLDKVAAYLDTLKEERIKECEAATNTATKVCTCRSTQPVCQLLLSIVGWGRVQLCPARIAVVVNCQAARLMSCMAQLPLCVATGCD